MAFKGCTSLQAVMLNEVETIGESAFEDCIALEALEVSTVNTVEKMAFKGCTSLQAVMLNEVETIGESAFESCIEVETLSISMPREKMTDTGDREEVTTAYIGSRAFAGCSNIAEFQVMNCDACADDAFVGVTIPAEYALAAEVDAESGEVYITGLSMFNKHATVLNIPREVIVSQNGEVYPAWCTGINEGAFDGKSQLTQVTIAKGLTSIGATAFNGCTGLTSVLIPNSVTQIGAGAFAGCTSLASIMIPNSVTQIGAGAFAGCTNLEAVYVPATCMIGEGAFTESRKVYTAAELAERLTDMQNSDFRVPYDGLELSIMQETGLINAIVETSIESATYAIPDGYESYVVGVLDADTDIADWIEKWDENGVEAQPVSEQQVIMGDFSTLEENQIWVLVTYRIDEAEAKSYYLVTPKIRFVMEPW